jgi:hypothetical protein
VAWYQGEKLLIEANIVGPTEKLLKLNVQRGQQTAAARDYNTVGQWPHAAGHCVSSEVGSKLNSDSSNKKEPAGPSTESFLVHCICSFSFILHICIFAAIFGQT